jgi:hypothetical protein
MAWEICKSGRGRSSVVRPPTVVISNLGYLSFNKCASAMVIGIGPFHLMIDRDRTRVAIKPNKEGDRILNHKHKGLAMSCKSILSALGLSSNQSDHRFPITKEGDLIVIDLSTANREEQKT